MKRSKFFAVAIGLMPLLLSCSGGGNSSSASLFGTLPGEYSKFQTEKNKITEEATNIKSEAEKAKLIEKSKKLQEKWSTKIEECAKNLDGKPIEFAESNFKVIEPISLEFNGFSSQSDLTPKFLINGSAEAQNEINTDYDYVLPSEQVYFVGYDADGQEVYHLSVGTVAVENIDGKSVVTAGTPIKFSSLRFYPGEIENYEAAKTLKLEVDR